MKEKKYDHLNRCRKAYDKIQHLLMIKKPNKLSIEEMYLNIMKDIHDKSTADIILFIQIPTYADSNNFQLCSTVL